MRPSEFLTILWGQQPPGFIQLWQLAGKRSYCLQGPGQADYYADGQTDVYVGVGLAHRDRGRVQRAKAGEIVGLAGLWLDVDVDGGPEDKRGGVPSLADAVAIARRGPTPTLLVESGYGLHGWWLFEQPWRFTSRDEQEQAATASAQWYALARAAAREHGWGIDHTHDLTRLLRPPSTFNGKGGGRAPVTVSAYEPTARYTVAALLEYAAQAGPITTPGSPPIGGETQPAGGVETDVPVSTRLRALIDNDPTFADSWRNERVDAPYWSMSEYDLSIATQLAQADWTNTDIAAAITLHRLRHDRDDLKAYRPDYLQRTVAIAREHAATGTAAEQLQLLADAGRAAA